MAGARQGPLSGFRVIEFAGIGPGPFCAMLLADMGADVICIERESAESGGIPPERNPTRRGRRSVSLNIKTPRGREAALCLVDSADALIEGYRPGVMERLGLGPDACLERNPRLVYGRMTGFGQDGPLAQAAGHDITYIALTGALHAIGPAGGKPVPPLNLVGDFGGGGLYLALGIVSAMLHCSRSGQGQVVDAAMVDGAASLMTMFYAAQAAGAWTEERGANMLDGGAPFYDTYATKDGGYVAVGALEGKFFAELARIIGLHPRFVERQRDRSIWPEMRGEIERLFALRTRREWADALEGRNACAAAVYALSEAPAHAHNIARRSFFELGGVVQPAPAPRFSATPSSTGEAPCAPGKHTADVLGELGFTAQDIAALHEE